MKGIIFDMDGVIVDSEPVHFKLEREILDEQYRSSNIYFTLYIP